MFPLQSLQIFSSLYWTPKHKVRSIEHCWYETDGRQPTKIEVGGQCWITKFKAKTDGQCLALRDVKAMLIHVAGKKNITRKVFTEASLSAVINTNHHNEKDFNIQRNVLWGTIRERYPTERDPSCLVPSTSLTWLMTCMRTTNTVGNSGISRINIKHFFLSIWMKFKNSCQLFKSLYNSSKIVFTAWSTPQGGNEHHHIFSLCFEISLLTVKPASNIRLNYMPLILDFELSFLRDN